MSQKAHILFQLAQAAAREGRQQVRPQVALNVWDTLTGGPTVSAQPSATSPTPLPAATASGTAGGAAAADDRLAPGLNLLGISSKPLVQAGFSAVPWAGRPAQQLAGLAGVGSSNIAAQAAAGVLNRSPAAPVLGVRRQQSHFHSNISLNKQIMNTHNMRELHTIVRNMGDSFDFFNISSAIARVPKLANPSNSVQGDATAKALVDDLASLMATHINTFDARGLANASWALGKLKYASNPKLPALIAAAAMDKMEAFSAQNLSNLLWSFVYLHHRNDQLLTAVAQQVVSKVNDFKPQELANTMWALASMDYQNGTLMEVVSQRVLELVDKFKEQELSNLVWAFAKLHYYDEQLFGRLMSAVAGKLQHFLPQGVSNTAWAVATAGHKDEQLFSQLLAKCKPQMAEYDVQGLSNMLWAAATLGYKDEAFLATAMQELTSRLDRMSSQNLSNALWAFASLGYVGSSLLGSWAEAVQRKLDLFEPQGLSNTAWAFAKLNYHKPQLFEAIANASVSKLGSFTAQGLSNIAWAYATAGVYHPALMQQLAHQVCCQVSSFHAKHCSVTAWALATLRFYNAATYQLLLEQFAVQINSAEPQNVANTLWAFARTGHPMAEHSGSVVSAAKQLLPYMNQQELCNTVWALAVLDHLDLGTWQEFCRCIAGLQDGLTTEGQQQAYHAQLLLHSNTARAAGMPLASIPQGLLIPLPEPLHTSAKQLWLASAKDVHISKLQADVSAALQLAGIPNTMEWQTDDGLFSIDIAFELDKLRIAVEVDGNHHYTNSMPQRPLSEVLVRRRLLQDRGWQVVNISYLDWESLPADTASKAAALLQHLSVTLDHSGVWEQVGLPQRGHDAAAVCDLSRNASQAALAAPCAAYVPTLKVSTDAMQDGVGYDQAPQGLSGVLDSLDAAPAVGASQLAAIVGSLGNSAGQTGTLGPSVWGSTDPVWGVNSSSVSCSGWDKNVVADLLALSQVQQQQLGALQQLQADQEQQQLQQERLQLQQLQVPWIQSRADGSSKSMAMPAFSWADPLMQSLWGPAQGWSGPGQLRTDAFADKAMGKSCRDGVLQYCKG
eukprot:GHRR01007140.1.p1 GENE.GHRR01007140.1~~GHRR01007140.1.p1  ORF type:complete len:1066 (+),score=457.18 GHRR01007140.1:335-3532(+)